MEIVGELFVRWRVMQHGFDVCECVSPERSLSVTRSIVDRIGSYSYLCVQTRLNIIRGDLLSGVDYRYVVCYTGDPQKKTQVNDEKNHGF